MTQDAFGAFLVTTVVFFALTVAFLAGRDTGREQACQDLLHDTTAVYKKGATPCVVPGATNQEGE